MSERIADRVHMGDVERVSRSAMLTEAREISTPLRPGDRSRDLPQKHCPSRVVRRVWRAWTRATGQGKPQAHSILPLLMTSSGWSEDSRRPATMTMYGDAVDWHRWTIPYAVRSVTCCPVPSWDPGSLPNHQTTVLSRAMGSGICYWIRYMRGSRIEVRE